MKEVGRGAVQVSEQASVTEKSMDAPHEELNMEVIAPQEGYLFSYLAHEEEQNMDVYFDDFAITLAGGPIVQVDDFYPYGMTFNHEATESAVLNRYLFQGKEKLSDDTDWYDFHARLYSPALGRFLGVDPQGQFANPYNGMGNNPVIGVDPDGEFVFTALALLIPGAQVFLPIALGADIGLWQGGSIANGTANPLQWNYSSGKTWGYMAGGAAVGGLSGGTANAVATSGMAFANTAAIATGSLLNSVGTFAYTGGQTDISVSFGAASYNFTQGKLGHLGKKGNSLFENVGYGLGGLANLADITPYMDKLTHWEDKIAAKADATADQYETLGHTRGNLDPNTEGINLGGASYPGPKNPRFLNSDKYYYGRVKNWGPREYAGYLHDVAYENGNVSEGLKMFAYGKRLIGADLQFAGRQMYLSLKHSYGYGLLLGGMSSAVFGIKPLIPGGYGF